MLVVTLVVTFVVVTPVTSFVVISVWVVDVMFVTIDTLNARSYHLPVSSAMPLNVSCSCPMKIFG